MSAFAVVIVLTDVNSEGAAHSAACAMVDRHPSVRMVGDPWPIEPCPWDGGYDTTSAIEQRPVVEEPTANRIVGGRWYDHPLQDDYRRAASLWFDPEGFES